MNDENGSWIFLQPKRWCSKAINHQIILKVWVLICKVQRSRISSRNNDCQISKKSFLYDRCDEILLKSLGQRIFWKPCISWRIHTPKWLSSTWNRSLSWWLHSLLPANWERRAVFPHDFRQTWIQAHKERLSYLNPKLCSVVTFSLSGTLVSISSINDLSYSSVKMIWSSYGFSWAQMSVTSINKR